MDIYSFKVAIKVAAMKQCHFWLIAEVAGFFGTQEKKILHLLSNIKPNIFSLEQLFFA